MPDDAGLALSRGRARRWRWAVPMAALAALAVAAAGLVAVPLTGRDDTVSDVGLTAPSPAGTPTHLPSSPQPKRTTAVAPDPAVSGAATPAAATVPSRPVVPVLAAARRGWSVLPAAPLSARRWPYTVTVGDTVLVLGGLSRSQTLLRDGAAYDLSTRRWHRLRPAPGGIADDGNGSAALLGGVVHVLRTNGVHLRYDVRTDRWTAGAQVPGEDGQQPRAAVAAGDVLVASQPSQSSRFRRPDQLYDPRTDAWSELPDSPLTESGGRQYVWTGRQLVLIAGGEERSAPLRAAVFDLVSRTWRRLPDSPYSVGPALGWTYNGRMLVDATRGRLGSDGFPHADGTGKPVGGELDPQTGRWSPPVSGPKAHPFYDPRLLADGPRYQGDQDALFDTQTRRWLTLPPSPRQAGSEGGQTWVGDVLFVWGGVAHGSGSPLLATGALYRP